MQTIAVVVDRFLLDIRTYIYEEITAIKKYNILVLTRKRENANLYPYKNVYTCKNFLNPLTEFSRTIKKNDVKLIHIKFGTSALRYLDLKKMTGLPLIVSFHGYDASGVLNNPLVLNEYQKKLFPKADHIITVSQKLKDNLVNAGCPKDKITVLWSGIDLEKFYYKPRKIKDGETVKILSIARLTSAKGLKYLIESFAKVVKERPNTELLIVGEGELKVKLNEQIYKLGLGKKVKIKGFVPHYKIPDILHKHHIFCLPSVVKADGTEEGTPNVLKEAQATGMPIVSTYHSGIPHVIQDGINGFLVEERNPVQLAEKLIYLIDNPDTWLEMGRRGREHAEKNFDKYKQARKVEELYSNIIKE
ncbi:MAG: colanic acid biosynthesis glycosyltransferase WcaL [Clostridiaceae bacterium]|nr:colanic acid biosynthesis glycosyltransferase WcaL [Clostridiaceae bacterium]